MIARNDIIRATAGAVIGAPFGVLGNIAATWLCSAAALGTFLSIIVWFATMALVCVSAYHVGKHVGENFLSDDQIDRGIATARGWFSKLSTRGVEVAK